MAIFFPSPVGKLVLHLIKRVGCAEQADGPDGVMVAFEEVRLKFFGPASPLHLSSKETLRNWLKALRPPEGHHEVCTDAGIKGMLTRAGVLGHTASKVCLLSIQAVIALLKRRAAGPGWIQPLQALDLPNMFTGRIAGCEDEPLHEERSAINLGAASPGATARALAGRMKRKRQLSTAGIAWDGPQAEQEPKLEKPADKLTRKAARKAARRAAKKEAARRPAAQQAATISSADTEASIGNDIAAGLDEDEDTRLLRLAMKREAQLHTQRQASKSRVG